MYANVFANFLAQTGVGRNTNQHYKQLRLSMIGGNKNKNDTNGTTTQLSKVRSCFAYIGTDDIEVTEN